MLSSAVNRAAELVNTAAGERDQTRTGDADALRLPLAARVQVHGQRAGPRVRGGHRGHPPVLNLPRQPWRTHNEACRTMKNHRKLKITFLIPRIHCEIGCRLSLQYEQRRSELIKR